MRGGFGRLGRRRADDPRPQAAHLLRRLTFGPFPGAVERVLDDYDTPAALVEAQLAAAPKPFEPPGDIDAPARVGNERINARPGIDNAGIIKFWLTRMAADDAGLHEKMMWFWHTVFTTSGMMGTDIFLWRQLRKLHEHALGNLKELAKKIVVDPAMMQFLNSDSSQITHPNENLARELMELFTLGIGHYTEQDVRAAAIGLAGWRIDFSTNTAVFDPGASVMPEVEFLGKRAVFSPDLIVDQIFEQPAVGPFIVGKLWRYFIGGKPDAELVDTWATEFRQSGYEIRPLLASMLGHDSFLHSATNRPRQGVEWFAPVLRVLRPERYNNDNTYIGQSVMTELGQVPYFPPNVAGWPDESRWLSSSTAFARASYIARINCQAERLQGKDRVFAALHRCGVYDPSDHTVEALRTLERSLTGPDAHRDTALVKAVFLSPEYALS